MLNLKKVLKSYSETGSLNEQVNLYGFVDPHAFLTKSGDVGVILQVHGVDYECLDPNSLDTLTKRLESALKLFDENFRIYQYLFKRNNEPIPYKKYANPIVNTAIENRIRHFAEKSDKLYSLQIFYVVVFEGFRYKRALLKSLTEFHKNPKKALEDLSAAFSSRRQVVLLDREITKALAALNQKVKSFILQVSDFVQVELLGKQEAFRVLKRTLNFAPQKLQLARLKHDTFLDYYLCESHLECHRGHLKLDNYYVKVLTLKEPPAQSFPLIFKHLLEVQAMVTNTYLKIALVLLAFVAVALGLIDMRTIRTFQNFRPLVIRIDQLGRAEALSYANFEYKPQDDEAKYFLSQFCALYYRRNRYTMNDDFSKSLYFLDGKLASDIIDAYKKNGVIKSFLTDPSQPEIDIEVKNVALEGMQASPYKARVDFDMVYYSAADHSELKRTLYTANFVFVFKANVPNELIPINPLGLAITYFREDEAFR